jgi:K+-transporting ATPase ATPase A chain
MQRGELVFGRVGAGLYGMLIFVVLTVFIAALMVGRTPELLRKKINRRAVRIAILRILVLPFFALVSTAISISISIVLPIATGQFNNACPHGFSEMLFMFTSPTENDGLAGKRAVAETAGTFTTYSPIFVRLLLSVLIIVGALTFVPADALGPIVERLLTLQGTAF